MSNAADSIPRLGQEPLTVPEPEPEDERLWSVTTLLKVYGNDALIAWAALRTAECAVDELHAWRSRFEHEGRGAAVDYLKRARYRFHGLSDAEHGSVVHELCQRYALTGSRPAITDDMHPKRGQFTQADRVTLTQTLDQFDRFLQEFAPAYRAAEVAVFSPLYGYAGTLDAILAIDGVELVADYKSSRKTYTADGKLRGPYPEVGLQLAAYRYAEIAAVWRARRFEQFRRRYYLLSEAERAAAVPVPPTDGGVAIYLTPEHYAVHPVRCDAAMHERFLFTIEAARWYYLQQGSMVGPPMIPPHPLPAPQGDPFAGLPT